VLTTAVAGVWLVHGLFNKLMHGSPRHLLIVQSVPGLHGDAGQVALILIGLAEVGFAIWLLSGWRPIACAAAQTVALLSMNVLELAFARQHLLWPAGLLPINVAFLLVAWVAAILRAPPARLRRHPVAVVAHFDEVLVLTYALPAEVLRSLVPPGLELETIGDLGFVAVAMVQTRGLRPAGAPRWLGRDFFLTGYRVFTKFRSSDGRTIRGLRILRSDTDRRLMVLGGNLLTHYNYRHCDAAIGRDRDHLAVSVRSTDGSGDVDVEANLGAAALPPGSPFRTEREARRFAGPLPYTFDYEPQTHSIIAIKATRANWQPSLIDVNVRRLSFFDTPELRGCTPVLAAAFHVHDIDYRWERGVRHALKSGDDQ
jgi:uncharacterized protein YqjF (DUF2071 family)